MLVATTLSLSAAVIGDTYKMVTSVDDITVGDDYILCYETNALGSISGNYYSAVTAGVTLKDDVATISNATVQTFKIENGKTSGCFAFLMNNTSQYLQCKKVDNNNLGEISTLNTNCDLKLSFDNSGNIIIIPNSYSNADKNKIQYNVTSPRFSNYKTGSQKNAVLYKKYVSDVPDVPVDYNPAWENVSMMEGDTKQLVLGGSHPEIAFTSSNPTVASIDAEGLITAAGVGSTTISATWGASDKFNAGSKSFDVEVTKFTASDYIKTDITNLSTGDKVVIVDLNSVKALSPNGTSGAPSAVDTKLTDDGMRLLSEPTDAIVFEVTATDGSYNFAQGSNHLYCTATNNGVRFGTNANKAFTWENGFLKNTATSRYVGVYNKQDWRCYTSTTGNIADTKTAFFKLDLGDKLAKPVFTPAAGAVMAGSEVTITAARGNVYYTTDDSEPTASSTPYTIPIIIDKAMTIKAIAIDGDKMSDVATADYTLIPTSTLAEAIVMTDGADVVMGEDLTVTYAHGDYLYVTAGGAYGLVYSSKSKLGDNFTAGDVVKALWSGKIKSYKNLIEIVPDNVADLVKNGTAEVPAPRVLSSATELTDQLVNVPVAIRNVTITQATPATATSFTGTIQGDNGEIKLYNQFTLPSVEPGVYDIEGIGNIFDTTLQVYVTSMTVVPQPCAVPSFSIPSGEIEYGTAVTISTTTEGAAIVYCINDGDLLQSEGNSVTITVDKNMVIEAYATGEGYKDSEIATATYTVPCPYETEALSPAYTYAVMMDEHNTPIEIELVSAHLEGVDIYHRHIAFEDETPEPTGSPVARAVDHTGFEKAATNSDNNHVITVTKPGVLTYYGYHAGTDTKGPERVVTVLAYDITGIEGIDADNGGTPAFYNLQGSRVECPAAGNVYIIVRGNKATKVLMK